MEIKINIPKNTYTIPTEIRQEVVQMICEAFLEGWTFFAEHQNGSDRYVERKDYGTCFFQKIRYDNTISYRIHGCEMETAIKALREAGYHIFWCNEYGSKYMLSKKPHLDGGTGREVEVDTFMDFID